MSPFGTKRTCLLSGEDIRPHGRDFRFLTLNGSREAKFAVLHEATSGYRGGTARMFRPGRGQAMKRGSKAGGKTGKSASEAATLRRGPASKAVPGCRSATRPHETEIARLTRERDEAVQQQTAIAEVLQIISSSPGELEPVFESLLQRATSVCHARFGNLVLSEGDGFRVVAIHNAVPAVDTLFRGQLLHPHPQSPLSLAAKSKRLCHVDDLRATPPYLDGNKAIVMLADVGGARTFLCVPLLKKSEVAGVIVLYRNEVRPFTDQQIALIETFAAQAVIAIENTRLLNELRQRTGDLTEALEQQTATSEVLQAISNTAGDLETAFTTMLEKAVRICQAAFGNIFRWDGEFLHLVAAYNTPPAYVEYRKRKPLRANNQFAIARMINSKAPVHTTDLKDDAYAEAVELGGFNTLLAVPMLKDANLIGAITVARREVRPFTDKQIALVHNFAAQAAVAIENARLLNELRQRTDDLTESLEQQTATSEILQIISSSPGDLQPVFAAMLEKAVRICDAKFGNIYRWDGETAHLVATHNTPPAFAEHRRRFPHHRPDPERGLGRMFATRQTVRIADARTEPSYVEQRNSSFVAAVELGGVRSYIAAPMEKDGELIGGFTLCRHEVRPFTEKQIALVTSFAAQAVIAIENARLLTELRESLQQQTATADVLKVISRSTFDLRTVLDTLVQSAASLCEADTAAVSRQDGDGTFHQIASCGYSPEFDDFMTHHPIPAGRGSISGRVVEGRKIVQIADLQSDPSYALQASAEVGGLRTMLGVPLLREGNPIGVLVLSRKIVRPFTAKQIELVEIFADQAVIAIENVRLLDALHQRTEDLGRSVDELRALGEVSQAVNSTLDLQSVLETIVAKAVQLSGTEAGAIYVFDQVQSEFHLHATYGMDRTMIDALRQQHIGLGDPTVVQALGRPEPIQVADLGEEKRTSVTEVILRAGFRALLVVPSDARK
jgi:two-component system, NtrC family, sensor kinase